ncbi:ATP-grasp domain-containing protein [Streptomyces prunicolor]
MTQQRALLIGWQLEAVTALRDLGADVACVLTPPDDEKRADVLDDEYVFPVQDPANTEWTLAALKRRGASAADFDVVCAPSEDTLVNAAVVGGTRSRMTADRALVLRDKDLQKSLIRSAGIPVADSQVIVHAGELARFRYPRGVLKPLDGSGTVGVRTWHDAQERAGIVDELESAKATGPWLAEQWVDGAELHFDGVVRNGEVRFLSVGRYLQNVLAIRNGGLVASVSLRPDRHPEFYDRARELTAHAMKALEHHDGVFHLEAFEQGDRLVFGECAGRIGGGLVDRVVRHQYGVDLRDEWARTVLGLESTMTPSTSEATFGFVSLFTPAGRLRSGPAEHEVAAREGVRYATLRACPGDLRPDPAEASNRPAALAVVAGEDEQQTTDRMRGLASWFSAAAVMSPTDGGQE